MYTKEELISKLHQTVERPVLDDGPVADTGMHVMLMETWIPVELPIWRSWIGRRSLWGQEYHGPVFNVDATDDSTPWTGQRICTCSKCQAHVSPESRLN